MTLFAMVDFSAIRKKLEQLSSGPNVFWSPKPGSSGSKEFMVRILPWSSDAQDDIPFKMLEVHYGIGTKPFLGLSQFDEDDPVQQLIGRLRKSGEFEAAKKLYPAKRWFAPIIVRGEEDAGVRLWSFGKTVCKELMEHMVGDFGDITHLKTGRDVKVVVVQLPGKSFPDTKATPRIKESPAGDEQQVAKWMASIPDVLQVHRNLRLTTQEVEKRLDAHINGRSEPKSDKSKLDALAALDDIIEEDV